MISVRERRSEIRRDTGGQDQAENKREWNNNNVFLTLIHTVPQNRDSITFSLFSLFFFLYSFFLSACVSKKEGRETPSENSVFLPNFFFFFFSLSFLLLSLSLGLKEEVFFCIVKQKKRKIQKFFLFSSTIKYIFLHLRRSWILCNCLLFYFISFLVLFFCCRDLFFPLFLLSITIIRSLFSFFFFFFLLHISIFKVCF